MGQKLQFFVAGLGRFGKSVAVTLEKMGYDEVLVLYNFQTFISDANLIYITRPTTIQ